VDCKVEHSSIERLFKVDSRYVLNLTRQDGSAFAVFLERKMKTNNAGQNSNDE